ncbi:ABC-type proline/glycine betaine transport systems periplasmic component [Rubrobacter radiotolerans]|uniref:ABC-type proline/glycine betaine transport systems periplasmic component n=1 Tax=Rubrobacter radiotolerans TaxID=42256 RepID=A0A023X0Q4_RUBRA|nr:glycine betaine ABC transporter substrate-binding protein [Rubrobacter radiotolerans]AHY45928.1 ABC-type proline/glycine betaine transport systems periplasmic component [Rubrobacter radiotolerans]MDX5893342.1 glycine betaine ABC transporter substrate-binding protein [Rubrobacter radiotolerans]SMC03538.1 glycine betaine/proline transport system substrate-binding protein [Rubrobacter radiotolerans DSM 5868]
MGGEIRDGESGRGGDERRESAPQGRAGLRLIPLILAGAVILAFGAFFAEGCGVAGASRDLELNIGYIEWDENVANSALIKVLAEDRLGYEVNLERSDLPFVIEGVAEGDFDVFMDVWLPAHRPLVEEAGDSVVLSREPWYVGETEFGIAVPDYMEETRSLEDLNSSGAGMITGIEPGALLMKRIQSRVIPEYDLDLVLVESSTPAMLSELDRAYSQRRPFVFLAWSPHWMNARYDFHYLEDPKGTMEGIVDPSKLHSLYNEDFQEEDPVAHALIDSMRLTESQMSDIELHIVRSGSPEEGARRWVEENEAVVEPWLEAANAAGGIG